MRSGLNTLGRALRTGRTAVLTLGGFGCLAAAAWLALGLPIGLAAIGVSLLCVEALGDRGDRR